MARLTKKDPRVVVTKHCAEQWRKRIGNVRLKEMQRRLQSAIKNKKILCVDNTFVVPVAGRKIVGYITTEGCWLFVTVLEPWMEVQSK